MTASLSPRKISDWTSTAYNSTWALIGLELRNQAVEVLGYERAVDVQFGNLLGWLRDCGEHALANQIKAAIKAHNDELICPSCGADLRWFDGRPYCGAHGYIRR